MNAPDPSLAVRIRIMQIVAGALTAGSTTALAVMIFVVHNQGHGSAQRPEGAPPIVSYLALGLLAVQVPLSLFLPAVLVRQGLARLAASPPNSFVVPPSRSYPGGPISDEGYLLGLRLTSMLVSMALLEGASFCASIAYLVEAQPFTIAVSALPILLLLAQFPFEGRIMSWLERQRFALNDLRMKHRLSPPL